MYSSSARKRRGEQALTQLFHILRVLPAISQPIGKDTQSTGQLVGILGGVVVSIIIGAIFVQGVDLRLKAEPGGGRLQLPPTSTQRNRNHDFQLSLCPLVVPNDWGTLAPGHPWGHQKISSHFRSAGWA